MTTFTWKINQLDRQTADGYVFTVHYRVDAQDDTYSTGAYGSIGLDRPDTLIPYSDLIEDTVVNWVTENLGSESVSSIETALQAQLDEQRTPTKATGIPWPSN